MAISLGPNGITANGDDILAYDSATGQLEIFHNGTAVLQTLSNGVQASNVTASLNGNGNSASALNNARTIALTGAVSGSVSFDGSQNVSMATSFAGGGGGGITSSAFDDAVTLNIYDQGGSIVKTLRSPGS